MEAAGRLLTTEVPCYAGGIDLDAAAATALLRADRRAISSEGFRAIKMKVGRKQLSEDVERVRGHARAIWATAFR